MKPNLWIFKLLPISFLSNLKCAVANDILALSYHQNISRNYPITLFRLTCKINLDDSLIDLLFVFFFPVLWPIKQMLSHFDIHFFVNDL